MYLFNMMNIERFTSADGSNANTSFLSDGLMYSYEYDKDENITSGSWTNCHPDDKKIPLQLDNVYTYDGNLPIFSGTYCGVNLKTLDIPHQDIKTIMFKFRLDRTYNDVSGLRLYLFDGTFSIGNYISAFCDIDGIEETATEYYYGNICVQSNLNSFFGTNLKFSKYVSDMITITLMDGNVYVYFNDTLIGSGSDNGQTNLPLYGYAGNNYWGTNDFYGSITALACYNRGLTQEEVKRNYENSINV